MSRRVRRPLSHPVIRTAGNLYLVQGAVLLLPLITLPYLTRTLSPSNLGLLLFAQAYASLATVILQYGFDSSASREVARVSNDVATLRRLVTSVLSAQLGLLVLSVVVSLLVWVAVPLFREHPAYLVMSWALSMAQGLSPLWFFLGRESLGILTTLDLSGKIVGAAAIFLLVHHTNDGIIVLAIQTATTSVVLVLAMLLLYRQSHFSRPRLGLAKAALRGSMQLAIYRVWTTIGQLLPPLLMGVLTVPAQVGYYGVADKLQRVPAAVLWPLSQALYPNINRRLETDPDGALRLARRSGAIFVISGAAIGLALAAAAPQLVLLLFGHDYRSAVGVFRVLALAIPFALVGHVLAYQLLMPLKHDAILTRVTTIVFAFRLAVAVPLTAALGAQGMAWAVLIAAAVNAAVLWVITMRRLGPVVRDAAAPAPDAALPMVSRIRNWAPRVAAVIVTHDRLGDLQRCIAAVRAQTFPVAGIVVVDNASLDGTAAWLTQQVDIMAVRQGDEGSAGGMFAGISYALAAGFNAFWMLDDDALPEPSALERLVRAPANDGTNVVGSLVVSPDDPELLSFSIPKVSSYSRLLDHHFELTDRVADLRAESDDLGYPWSMFTNSTLLPREIVEKIGLPRREFYMGGEEVEYHYRVRSHGFGTYLILDSICRHPKRDSRDIPAWKRMSLARNTVYIHRRYRRWFILRTVRRLLVFLVTGRPRFVRAVWDGIREDFTRRYGDAVSSPRPSP